MRVEPAPSNGTSVWPTVLGSMLVISLLLGTAALGVALNKDHTTTVSATSTAGGPCGTHLKPTCTDPEPACTHSKPTCTNQKPARTDRRSVLAPTRTTAALR